VDDDHPEQRETAQDVERPDPIGRYDGGGHRRPQDSLLPISPLSGVRSCFLHDRPL
jgi:hypothetical protein